MKDTDSLQHAGKFTVFIANSNSNYTVLTKFIRTPVIKTRRNILKICQKVIYN